MEKCHICGAPTDFLCESCEEPVCEDCTAPYDQFTQIDYDLCSECYEIELEERGEELYDEEEYWKAKEKRQMEEKYLPPKAKLQRLRKQKLQKLFGK